MRCVCAEHPVNSVPSRGSQAYQQKQTLMNDCDCLKAVFFDLDDTLVATSEHDERAFSAAVDLAASRSHEGVVVDRERLLADFKSTFKITPWDPEYQVDVTEWRARLWKQALKKQNVPDAAALGSALQVCTTR